MYGVLNDIPGIFDKFLFHMKTLHFCKPKDFRPRRNLRDEVLASILDCVHTLLRETQKSIYRLYYVFHFEVSNIT